MKNGNSFYSYRISVKEPLSYNTNLWFFSFKSTHLPCILFSIALYVMVWRERPTVKVRSGFLLSFPNQWIERGVNSGRKLQQIIIIIKIFQKYYLIFEIDLWHGFGREKDKNRADLCLRSNVFCFENGCFWCSILVFKMGVRF